MCAKMLRSRQNREEVSLQFKIAVFLTEKCINYQLTSVIIILILIINSIQEIHFI